jgi:hypothetical protein
MNLRLLAKMLELHIVNDIKHFGPAGKNHSAYLIAPR